MISLDPHLGAAGVKFHRHRTHPVALRELRLPVMITATAKRRQPQSSQAALAPILLAAGRFYASSGAIGMPSGVAPLHDRFPIRHRARFPQHAKLRRIWLNPEGLHRSPSFRRVHAGCRVLTIECSKDGTPCNALKRGGTLYYFLYYSRLFEKPSLRKSLIMWRIRQDLNLQPSDPKSEALSN